MRNRIRVCRQAESGSELESGCSPKLSWSQFEGLGVRRQVQVRNRAGARSEQGTDKAGVGWNKAQARIGTRSRAGWKPEETNPMRQQDAPWPSSGVVLTNLQLLLWQTQRNTCAAGHVTQALPRDRLLRYAWGRSHCRLCWRGESQLLREQSN